jgi:hypothetical protein
MPTTAFQLTAPFLARLERTRPHITKYLRDHAVTEVTINTGEDAPRFTVELDLRYADFDDQDIKDELDRQVYTDKACIVLEGTPTLFVTSRNPLTPESRISKSDIKTGFQFYVDAAAFHSFTDELLEDIADTRKVQLIVEDEIGFIIEVGLPNGKTHQIDVDEMLCASPSVFWKE